jgi:hypothetical protein
MRRVHISTTVRVALATLLAFSGNLVAAVDTSNAATFLADINSRGVRAVLNDIWGKPDWDSLLTQVETGQKAWLLVAVRMYEATDAGSTEMLTSATGVALLTNPRYVLLQVAPTFGLENVCSGPDIDDARWSTKPQAIANLDERIHSVSALKGQDIAKARAACLKSLKADRDLLESPNGPYS